MDSANSRARQPVGPLTIQQHILQEQQKTPGATGEFSWLLSGLTLAAKAIQAKVSRAGLTDILGDYGETNVQGTVSGDAANLDESDDVYQAIEEVSYARGKRSRLEHQWE